MDRVVGEPERGREAVRVAALGQQPLPLFRIEWIRAHGGVAVQLRADDRFHLPRIPKVQRRDQRLLVDRVVHCQPHAALAERRVVLVHQQRRYEDARRRIDPHPGLAGERLDVDRIDRIDELRFPSLQHRERLQRCADCGDPPRLLAGSVADRAATSALFGLIDVARANDSMPRCRRSPP